MNRKSTKRKSAEPNFVIQKLKRDFIALSESVKPTIEKLDSEALAIHNLQNELGNQLQAFNHAQYHERHRLYERHQHELERFDEANQTFRNALHDEYEAKIRAVKTNITQKFDAELSSISTVYALSKNPVFASLGEIVDINIMKIICEYVDREICAVCRHFTYKTFCYGATHVLRMAGELTYERSVNMSGGDPKEGHVLIWQHPEDQIKFSEALSLTFRNNIPKPIRLGATPCIKSEGNGWILQITPRRVMVCKQNSPVCFKFVRIPKSA